MDLDFPPAGRENFKPFFCLKYALDIIINQCKVFDQIAASVPRRHITAQLSYRFMTSINHIGHRYFGKMVGNWSNFTNISVDHARVERAYVIDGMPVVNKASHLDHEICG